MRIEGIVIRGRQLGRTLGFPTANLRPDSICGDGPDGVYAAWFELDGQPLPCMLNIGSHPTLPGGGRTFEAHIFHFNGNLYGKTAAIETAEYLRPERKFNSPEALQRQLESDRERALAILELRGSAPKNPAQGRRP